MRNVRCVLSCGAIALLLAGCSSAFDRDWDNYGLPRTGDPLVGRWKGFWKSSSTGHGGDLRCIIDRRAEGRYDARFHATYGEWWTSTFEYTVLMEAERSGESWKLEGSEDLGWMAGGVYHYRGKIEGDTFECDYSAEEDRGVFRLTRFDEVASEPQRR